MKVCKSPLLTGHVERGVLMLNPIQAAQGREPTRRWGWKKSFCAKRC
jgi:hypothetical protein